MTFITFTAILGILFCVSLLLAYIKKSNKDFKDIMIAFAIVFGFVFGVCFGIALISPLKEEQLRDKCSLFGQETGLEVKFVKQDTFTNACYGRIDQTHWLPTNQINQDDIIGRP